MNHSQKIEGDVMFVALKRIQRRFHQEKDTQAIIAKGLAEETT
jgi:hypothetical protein